MSSWQMIGGQATNVITNYPWSGFLQAVGAMNNTGSTRSGYMLSTGTITVTVQWVGIGAAPSKVLMRISSDARGGVTPSGEITLDNGLGSLVVEDYETIYSYAKTQSGYSDRFVSIGSGGTGTIQISKNATASVVSGNNMLAFASAKGGSASVAERAVTVSASPYPTFYRGGNDLPVQNSIANPRDIRIDLRIAYAGYSPSYSDTTLTANLWGPWASPSGYWSWSDIVSPWQLAIVHKAYNDQTLTSMIFGAPETRVNTVTTIDQIDRFTDTAKVTVVTHAPWESPVWETASTVYDAFAPVSAWVVRSPNATTSVTESIAYAEAITKQMSITGTGGYPILAGTHPLVAGLNLQFQYSQTATVTTTTSYGYTIAAGPANREFRLVKRNFWKQKSGFYYAYWPSGYDGIRDMALTEWVSGTKEQAQVADHEYMLDEREYTG